MASLIDELAAPQMMNSFSWFLIFLFPPHPPFPFSFIMQHRQDPSVWSLDKLLDDMSIEVYKDF